MNWFPSAMFVLSQLVELSAVTMFSGLVVAQYCETVNALKIVQYPRAFFPKEGKSRGG